jgi:hypothetical protein
MGRCSWGFIQSWAGLRREQSHLESSRNYFFSVGAMILWVRTGKEGAQVYLFKGREAPDLFKLSPGSMIPLMSTQV